MWQDVANTWWAIIIANTVHQILWLVLLFGQMFVMRRETWLMLVPDILASLISANILLALLNHWDIDYPAALYAVLIYVVVVNLTILVRIMRSEQLGARRFGSLWLACANLGFLLFAIQVAVMTWIF